MRIDRPDLEAGLLAFVRAGHGLVLGRPGVGKTHTLLALARTFDAESHPHLFIAVEELGDAGEEDVRRALGYPDTFREALNALYASGSTGTVLFDGFDAARNPDARARLLQLVRVAVREAPVGWAVLVSVRNYDAAKSPALLSLFPSIIGAPGKIPARYQARQVPARHFIVPELTNDEVEAAVAAMPHVATAYARAGDGLRRLARVPFHLWLLDRVLRATKDPATVSGVESETQLLAKFWESHVTAVPDRGPRAEVLRRVTKVMVAEGRLGVRKATAYDPALDAAWEGLFSAEILTESGAAKERIGFAHNILFDYAVSVYAIADTPEALTAFLTADPTRPLFLRPSLVYHITDLWYANRAEFWNTFWELLAVDEVSVRLVGRLIPPAVVATEATTEDDLEPLIRAPGISRERQSSGILRALQALQFVEARNPAAWAAMAPRLAEIADPVFAWELASFLARSREVRRAKGSLVGDELETAVGRAARTLVAWVWRNRQPGHESWFDAFGAIHAVPLALASFGTDITAGREVVTRVLALVNEPAFPIRYFSALADAVAEIAPHAPDLVAEFYRVAFGCSEDSDEPTHLGGIILRLQSTRRQDFEMVRYVLAEAYPTFLRAAPEFAIAVGLDVLDQHALDEHVRPYLREGRTLDDLTESFHFGGSERPYIRDMSVSWGSLRRDETEKLRNALHQYLIQDDLSFEPAHAVALVAAHVSAASSWALLLDIGAAAPERYAALLHELALARPIQLGSDTLQALGTFVETASRYWTPEQRAAFERSVLALHPSVSPSGRAESVEAGDATEQAAGPEDGEVSGTTDEEDEEPAPYAARVRDRLLARIPTGLIALPDAQARLQVLASAGALPGNEPLVRFHSSSSPFTNDDWLAEQGVDLNAEANVALRQLRDALQPFGDTWRNAVPAADDVAAFLPTLKNALGRLLGTHETGVHPAPRRIAGDAVVAAAAWTALATAAHAVARARPPADSDAYALARVALITASEFPEPEVDREDERTGSHMSWSPSPRTEAAQGLPWLASIVGEPAVVERATRLARARPSAERFLAVHDAWRYAEVASEPFWELVVDRVAKEEHPAVLSAIFGVLARVIRHSEAQVHVHARALLERWAPAAGMGREFSRTLASWLVYFAIDRDEPWAWAVLRAGFDQWPERADLVDAVVLQTVDLVFGRAAAAHGAGTASSSHAPILDRAVRWLLEVVNTARERIAGAGAVGTPDSSGKSADSEAAARWYQLVDYAIRELEVAPRRSDRNTTGADEPANVGSDATGMQRDFRLRRYAEAISPLLHAIIAFSDVTGGLAAPSAHHMMQLLNRLLPTDPASMVGLAAAVALAGSRQRYHLDSIAVREVVSLVETVLADYRKQVRSGAPLEDLLRLLDLFADAGWPDAQRLVWHLDEVYR